MATSNIETQVLRIPHNAVLVDDAWNLRQGNYRSAQEDESTGAVSWEEWVQTFRDRGQERPVEVIPYKGRGKVKYRLVAGFRRFHATKEAGLPYVLAVVVKVENEFQARARNLTENIREGLRVCDQATGLAMLRQGWSGTVEELADYVGLSKGYVSQLCTIAESLRPELFEEWRAQQLPFPKSEVYRIARFDAEKQPEAWKELAESYTATTGADAGKKKSSPTQKANAKTKQIGTILGTIARAFPDLTMADAGEAFDDILPLFFASTREKPIRFKTIEKVAIEAFDAANPEEPKGEAND